MDAENSDGTFPYECSICSIRFQLMNDAKFHYENEHQNISSKIKTEHEGISTENNTELNIKSNEEDQAQGKRNMNVAFVLNFSNQSTT